MKRISAGNYYGPLNGLSRRIKHIDPTALREAADILAGLLPANAVIIPMPSHTGKPDGISALCRLLGEKTGKPICPVLSINGQRTSMYEAKNALKTGKSDRLPQPEELLIRRNGNLPRGLPVIVDNVIASGTTAVAALNALAEQDALILTLTDDITCPKINDFKKIFP